MKPARNLALWLTLVVAGLLAGLLLDSSAAQVGRNPGGPYHVSSYGGSSGSHGCYIIDITSGRLWHVGGDNKPTEIVRELQ